MENSSFPFDRKWRVTPFAIKQNLRNGCFATKPLSESFRTLYEDYSRHWEEKFTRSNDRDRFVETIFIQQFRQARGLADSRVNFYQRLAARARKAQMFFSFR